MAWRHHRIWIIVVLLITGLGLTWLIVKTPVQTSEVTEQPVVATTTESGDLTGRSIYTNGEHGFVISYPETARLEEVFASTYHLPASWRVNAAPETGNPIIAIVAYSTESDHSYPRYYHALVRVGVSDNAAQIAACEKVTPNQGETALADVTINGVVWKAFSFGDAAMQQYVRGVSYRTVHDSKCYALEKIAAGSNYKDDPDSTEDVADTLLLERYDGLDQIIESFVFAR